MIFKLAIKKFFKSLRFVQPQTQKTAKKTLPEPGQATWVNQACGRGLGGGEDVPVIFYDHSRSRVEIPSPA